MSTASTSRKRHLAAVVAAEALVATILERNLADALTATPEDLRAALRIGELSGDQGFSMIDRTSWAVMERLGIDEEVSFDVDFAVYRCGLGLSRAFTIHR